MIISCIARHNLFGSEKSLSSTFGGKRCVAASIFLPPFAAGPSFSFLKMADASRSSDELEIVTEFCASHNLPDADRLKLISDYKERPVLWDSNIDQKHAKEEKCLLWGLWKMPLVTSTQRLSNLSDKESHSAVELGTFRTSFPRTSNTFSQTSSTISDIVVRWIRNWVSSEGFTGCQIAKCHRYSFLGLYGLAHSCVLFLYVWL